MKHYFGIIKEGPYYVALVSPDELKEGRPLRKVEIGRVAVRAISDDAELGAWCDYMSRLSDVAISAFMRDVYGEEYTFTTETVSRAVPRSQ